MTNKGFSILIFGLILGAAMAFVGCTTAQPMTKKVEMQASTMGGVGELQIFISRNLVLTRTDENYITTTIQIAAAERGVLLKTEIDSATGYTVYYVNFEKNNNNSLRFMQRSPGVEERLYLVYDDYEKYTINYGGLDYTADWDAGKGLHAQTDNVIGKVKGSVQGVTVNDADQPYLLVKITGTESYRKASGHTVGK